MSMMVVEQPAEHLESFDIMIAVASGGFFIHLNLSFDSISLDQKELLGSR